MSGQGNGPFLSKTTGPKLDSILKQIVVKKSTRLNGLRHNPGLGLRWIEPELVGYQVPFYSAPIFQSRS